MAKARKAKLEKPEKMETPKPDETDESNESNQTDESNQPGPSAARVESEKLLASWTAEGRFMGDIRIKETIGFGSSGQVIAVSLRPNHPAFVESCDMCLKAAPRRSSGAEAILREIDIHATMRGDPPEHHPNVCWVYEAGFGQFPSRYKSYISDVCYLLMRRHRCDMLHVVEKAPLSVSGATGLLAQVVRGLTHIHRLGIAHRDIKLDNLLVGPDFNVSITDFGYATRHPVSHTYCGTLGYLAPEIGSPQGYTTKPVDVWSAGISFAISMLGTFPWDHAAPAEIRAQEIQRFGCQCNLQSCSCQQMETTRKLLFYLLHPDPLCRLRAETLNVETRDHECNEIMRREIMERCEG